jgi:hypothetical protein
VEDISEPAHQYMHVYGFGYHILQYMVKIYCNIRTLRICLYIRICTYCMYTYVYVCIS